MADENHRGTEHDRRRTARNSSRGSVRAGDQRILVSLERSRGSLARLRANPHVALAILTAGNCAFTALGRARIVQESMPDAVNHVAVEIDVEEI